LGTAQTALEVLPVGEAHWTVHGGHVMTGMQKSEVQEHRGSQGALHWQVDIPFHVHIEY
jgi:hypothetical protein